MYKARHRDLKNLLDLDFSNFEWISQAYPYEKMIPKTSFSFVFTFTCSITDVPNYEKERESFEQLIRDFYDVSKGRHQVLCLWEEKSVNVVVF